MILFLVACCVVLIILLGVSLGFNFKHASIILRIEDALSEALDVCDQSYNKMAGVLDIPVAVDTPEIRQIIAQIKAVQGSVLYVSNVLAEPYNGIIEEDANGVED